MLIPMKRRLTLRKPQSAVVFDTEVDVGSRGCDYAALDGGALVATG